MIRKLLAFTAAALLLAAAPAIAQATGNLVGSNCTASWNAVPDPFGGGVVTYNLYIAPGTPATPPANPLFANLPGTAMQPCKSLTVGQYSAWIQASDALPTGTTEVSPLNGPVPFNYVALPAPNGLVVK